MQSARQSDNEIERLQALIDYHILDTEPELDFDDLTQLASELCEMPIALISLIDDHRQWFKSHHGLDATETPKEIAFCSHAILQDEIFEIVDSRLDIRFSDNPLVTDAPYVIAYSGIPLKTPAGFHIGTLCVIDNKPRKLSNKQKQHLRIIAKQVINQFELRKHLREKVAAIVQQNKLINLVKYKNDELGQFAHRASHDLRAPLNQMSQLADFCMDDITDGNNSEAIGNCQLIKQCANKLSTLVNDLVELTRADLKQAPSVRIDFSALIPKATNETKEKSQTNGVEVQIHIQQTKSFYAESVRLEQIFYNLISNAIKYCNPKQDKRFVKIEVTDSDQGVNIIVSDNGLGIPLEFHDKFFDMFERFHSHVDSGSGLGSAIVKKHISAMNGSIQFTSSPQGTCFTIDIPNAL